MQELIVPLLAIAGGLVALVIGGDLLVRGASLLAVSMKISPLVVGLTVVAFGTSAPELGVSLQAAFSGVADVAVGNVVGSNILNVLLILGLASLVAPLLVSAQLVRFDVPFLIVVSMAMWGLSLDGAIGRLEGSALFAVLICYIVYCIRVSRRERRVEAEEFSHELPAPTKWTSSWVVQVALMIAGLGLLAVGARFLVDGAVTIAKLWEVSELIIGLTIVAAGTSLPEVVTSVVASFRGERDIAVGNVVGSNLFNILCVLGLSGLLSSNPIPVASGALQFDIPVMVAVACLCLPIFFTGGIISRTEGLLLTFFYISYTVFLITAESYPDFSQGMGSVFFYGVFPATAIGVLISVVLAFRQRKVATSTE